MTTTPPTLIVVIANTKAARRRKEEEQNLEKKKMPVKLAAGPTLKSTVNLPSESQNGDPGPGYDEINHQKRSVDDLKINGFNFLQSIKEDDKEEPDNREDDLEEEEERSDSCSIGECSSAEDETREEDEVESKQTDLEIKSSLSSLDSLEESLPIKRGLSNFYSGKSKSFTSLSNAANATAKDLVKPENPLNKRRRLLIAWSRNRRASCSSLVSIAESSLMPLQLQLLPPVVSECDEEEEREESFEQDDKSSSSSFSPSERMRRDKEKRRPSLFTVTVAPAQGDHDHNPGLSSISISKIALRSPGRSLSLSDLSRHAHVHAMTNLD